LRQIALKLEEDVAVSARWSPGPLQAAIAPKAT
jgi:hypothetical protein